jgi:pilus assembly protein CpaE
MNDVGITAVSPDKDHLGALEHALHPSANGNRAMVIEGLLQRLGALARPLAADILDCSGDSNAERASMDATIRRIATRARPPAARNGQVLAFVSCKGGSGATFLAANLAYALASHAGSKVALFDLNLQFGDALSFLSKDKASHTLTDVVRGIRRLDAALLQNCMVNVTPDLAVLAAPPDPGNGMKVQSEHIDALLAMARPDYDYVIVDVGRTLAAPTIRALDQADVIYAVLQPTLSCVRGAQSLLQVFRTLEYPERKVELIVNRYQADRDLGVMEIEAVLGKRVSRTVPNHYEMAAASAHQGIPITDLAWSSPVSTALTEWGAAMQDQPAQTSGNSLSRARKRT